MIVHVECAMGNSYPTPKIKIMNSCPFIMIVNVDFVTNNPLLFSHLPPPPPPPHTHTHTHAHTHTTTTKIDKT